MDRALARIDLGAVKRNCAHLAETVGDGVELCAVVKADGYGHGADGCASARDRGRGDPPRRRDRSRGRRRRPPLPARAGPDDGGARPPMTSTRRSRRGSDVALWHEEFRAVVAARARAQGTPARVHLKLDSGMGRLGSRDPAAILALAASCAADPDLELAGVWTHFATADEPDSDFFDEQLDRFGALAAAVRAEHPGVTVHAANSAAVFRDPRSHFDMVRCGVAVYGLDPFQGDPAERGLVAGALAPLLRRRRQALRAGRLGRLRAHLAAPSARPGSGSCRSATATASAAASPTTPRSWSGGGAIPWSARSRWTT